MTQHSHATNPTMTHQPPLILPSLLPRPINPLWYPKPACIDKNTLEQEEEEYKRVVKEIAESGNHFKPIGFSPETVDDDGEEEDDDDGDEMESEEEPEDEEIEDVEEEAGEMTEIDEEVRL
ncbi:hypothetical protein BC938DRAFT_478304 [Jimgerdemannia flammicorona]|uniref:Uncharacterized protein n=1 Tax=Jimgerdemannia flammicorona TaxID=994334 RepID=A0A433R0K6_9FUNG|nr:hypothetical protein BC938DRAFT_478304 [Jimgerdemannia flammicorona]